MTSDDVSTLDAFFAEEDPEMTCNQCSYSSIGRSEGVVKLYCGLMGQNLTEMPASCEIGRRADQNAEHNWLWAEGDADESPSCLLCQPL